MSTEGTASAKPTKLAIEPRRVLLDLSPPTTAHSFGWARVNEQFVFEVGYFDLYALSRVINDKDNTDAPKAIDWFITDRFVLDVRSAERLVEIATLLAEELKKMTTERTEHAS